MIKQLLPDTLEYLHNLNTEHLGALYTSHLQSRVSGIAETRCFLNFLSAVLERNSPKVDSSLTYTGTASRSSRVSSQMTESRASSAMLHSYSASSVQVYGTPRAGSYQTSRYVWCHLILTVILSSSESFLKLTCAAGLLGHQFPCSPWCHMLCLYACK